MPETKPETKDQPPPPQPAPPRRRRRWAWALLAILIGVAALFLLRNCQREEHAAKTAKARHTPPVPVTTGRARQGDIGVYLMGLGTVTPVYTVSVTSRVQGEVMRVDYREGQMVHKGDSLLVIDPRPYEAALRQAIGQLEHDQSLLKEAEIDLKRYAAAYQRNAIAQQQLADQAQVVKQDRGTVLADEGAVQSARVNLNYCYIRSPIDGRVGLRLVDPGNVVQPSSTTTLVVITQLQPITVIFSLSEDYLGEIQQRLMQGQKLLVTALDRTQDRALAQGTLLTLDNVVDTTTGTVKLRAQFPNTDFVLFPYQFVNARLLVHTLTGATLIPTAAIQRNAQGPFVYLITPQQTAVMHPIKVGPIDGETAAVEGISPGDEIAVAGFDKLREGAHIIQHAPPGPDGGPNPDGGSQRDGPAQEEPAQ